MANIIKIKQGGTGVTAPAAGVLKKGELGYTFHNDKLWVGSGDGNTDDALLIGGKLGSAVQAYDANIVSDAAYQATANDFTNTLKSKLDAIEASADVTDATNVASAGALMDSELAGIAAVKATTGTFLIADQTKLDTIATSANNYAHPTTAGNKHVPTGGASGQFLKYSASGTAVWAADNNTTYTVGDGGLTQNNFTTTLKNNYDASYNWYITMTTADGDSIIDTVTEIVSAFQNHAEGLNLITELDAKLTANSTIDGGTF
jgi:hypothetical protein